LRGAGAVGGGGGGVGGGPSRYAFRIDAAIGELSPFHETHGYYAHGVSPKTAILPAGWEQRVIRISNPNTGGATGLCIDAHDLVLSKYAAGREQDRKFNQALIRHGIVSRRKLTPKATKGE